MKTDSASQLRRVKRTMRLILAGVVVSGFLAGYVLFSYGNQHNGEPAPPPSLLDLSVGEPYSPTPTRTLSAPFSTPTPAIDYVYAYVTYYGWPDNDPPGRMIAYPKSRFASAYHEEAGGTGTYQDPITFASSDNVLTVGTKVYVPYIRKYAVKEDLCGSCGSGTPHIDIWMESDGSYVSELNECQMRYTRKSVAVETDPPPGRPVDLRPLFDAGTGVCLEQSW